MLPVGKLTGRADARARRDRADLGDGDIRLTVWQNLLISGVPDDKVALAEAAIEALGLSTKATSIRAGLVACTGNIGCKFAASDTKRHAEEIARWCETRVALDGPVNIHLTGCHHSCAQHYIGDIGLLACKVQTSEDGDTVEGYHILVGGGFGPDAALAREIYRDVKAEDAPRDRRAHAQGLSGAPRLAGGKLSGLHAPPRRRGAQDDVRAEAVDMNSALPHAATVDLLPEQRAVHARAARLAQRLLRRPDLARRRRHHGAVAGGRGGADAGCNARRSRSATATTASALARPDHADLPSA